MPRAARPSSSRATSHPSAPRYQPRRRPRHRPPGRHRSTPASLVGQTTLGRRTTTLHNAFVDVYNRDFKVIDACTSVDCEKVPKLEIAGSLKTYNDGLNAICWPDKYKAHATALMQANTAMADAFTTWATATTPAEDQSLQTAAKEQDDKQGVADDMLSTDLGVPLPTNAPS